MVSGNKYILSLLLSKVPELFYTNASAGMPTVSWSRYKLLPCKTFSRDCRNFLLAAFFVRALKYNNRLKIYYLFPGFYWLLTSSRAAAKPLRTKGENHKRWAAPPLKVLPFWNPFSLSPPVRSTWVGFIEFLLSVQRAENWCGEVIRTFAICIR